LSLFVFIITLSVNSFPQWAPASGNLNVNYFANSYAIEAVDSNYAVISTDRLYRTSNGGRSWDTITPPTSSIYRYHAIDISMTDSLNIWVGSGAGEINFTSDGGENWTIQFSDTSKTNFINYIKMFNPQNGIAMGDGKNATDPALFLRTTNGGLNWISVNDAAFGAWSGDTWRKVDFISPEAGYFFESGINPQSIYKTTDGCKTWKQILTPAYVEVLKFFDESLGFIYCSAPNISTLYRTSNGGSTWDVVFTTTDADWGMDIEFLKNDPSKIWFTNSNSLFFSNDSGKTWSEQFFPDTSIDGRDIVFTDAKCGWFLCVNNVVYRTTNGDSVYEVVGIEKDNLTSFDFSLEQNYPNPFNPTTVINYQLAIGGFVTIKIYDVLGNEIATLVNEQQQAGKHFVNFDATNHSQLTTNKLASGIYYYRLQAGQQSQTKGMIFLK